MMGNDAKRTPGKWAIEERAGHSIGPRDVITAPGVDRIAVVSKRGVPSAEVADANAAFIVQACNAHDALVAACEKFSAAHDIADSESWVDTEAWGDFDEAVAEAKGTNDAPR